MTFFTVLAAALGALATILLTRSLWWTSGARERDATAAFAARPSPSVGLAAALAVFVFGVAGGGYLWLGSPGHLGDGPASSALATTEDNAGLPRGGEDEAFDPQAVEQVSAMIDPLIEHLKTQPEDADGWQLLARTYAALGRHAQAVEAFRQAERLRPDDSVLLTDFAVSVGMVNHRSLGDESWKLIERALKLDPQNPKALALAGTIAFDRRDYQGAVQYWERLAQIEPADSPFAGQIQGDIAQARQLAGIPAAPDLATGNGATSMPPAASAAVLSATRAQVSGTVTLAPSLKGRVALEDTVFVIARAVDGPRMPLAVLRKHVRDLPLQFTLDDSLAMSPNARLSGASSVIVGARISRSGDALPQIGDLQGVAQAVAVGASGLRVEINEEVAR
ncbi:hypothetical protein LMG28614_05217 [Paraburkholderia ultramafica]|uniref:Uncharacterized protein n=1 Tax=Paraburkholderia ultramafica TaxID=1544867 RepID=A0A6S7BVM1_9BURK|nr:tetratricopeptide repeat protein [Paraburkholderia ultramafica]CAB3800571.1 hypothetical protein LMG28614_05217 [Paraburkholderia ultramafica]